MTKRIRNPKIVVTPARLWDIYQNRLEGKQNFYQMCWETFGFPVTQAYVPKASFLLMQCLEMARGPMAAGNWMDIGMEIFCDRTLSPGESVLANPFWPQVAFLESGYLMKW